MAVITTRQLCRDCIKVALTDPLDFPEAEPCAKVEINTPVTIDPKLNTSGLLKVSILHATATAALVMGSAALTVSTKAAELAKKDTGKTFYILDEPTTGLHFQDIQHLLDVLKKLVGKGNTVLVIEHNLDVIKVADHVIDLGPDGGEKGGEIVCVGTPEDIANNPLSHTGFFLKQELHNN